MDIDIIKDNTLVSSLTDVQFQISRPYNEYATLTVMRKSGEVIAKIKVLTLKDEKSTEIMMNKERKQKMYVFISQPMERLTNDEFKQRRLKLKISDMVKRRYPTEKIRFITNPLIANSPHNDSLIVWYLGKSLKRIASANLVFFPKDWESDYICSLEHEICRYYNIPIIHEDEYFTHKSVYANNSPLSPLVRR